MLASHHLSLKQKVHGGVKVCEREDGGREQEDGDGGKGGSEEGHEWKGIR